MNIKFNDYKYVPKNIEQRFTDNNNHSNGTETYLDTQVDFVDI